MDIGARAKKILHAVVSEYLATGEAVGSHTVTRRYGLDVSAATVRTVMGDLEEVGFLRHAHTSGGRLPTERGLRYYVDMLLRVRNLTSGEKDEIRERLAPAGSDVPEVMQRTSRMLRELSHLTVVVQAPRPDSDVVQHLEFVQLRDGQLLAVIAAASGQIQNKLVPIDVPLAPGDLDRINNFLNGLVSGLTLDQVRAKLLVEIASERAAHDQLAAQALRLAQAAVPVDPRAGRAGRRAVEPAGGQGRPRARQAAVAHAGGEGPPGAAARTDAERAGDLRLHRRGGEPGRSDRRVGGGGALRRRRPAARHDWCHRAGADELLAGDPAG